MWGDNCQFSMIICPPYYNYIYILFQLHKHRVQSTHLNEKSRQIFQSLSWLVSPCRTQANKPKLSFTIVFRNVDSGAKQWAVWAPTTKIQNIWPKPGPRMANIRKVTLGRSSRQQQQQTQNYKTKLFSVLVWDWGLRVAAGQCLDTPVTAILRRAPASPPSRDLAFSSPNDGE